MSSWIKSILDQYHYGSIIITFSAVPEIRAQKEESYRPFTLRDWDCFWPAAAHLWMGKDVAISTALTRLKTESRFVGNTKPPVAIIWKYWRLTNNDLSSSVSLNWIQLSVKIRLRIDIMDWNRWRKGQWVKLHRWSQDWPILWILIYWKLAPASYYGSRRDWISKLLAATTATVKNTGKRNLPLQQMYNQWIQIYNFDSTSILFYPFSFLNPSGSHITFFCFHQLLFNIYTDVEMK